MSVGGYMVVRLLRKYVICVHPSVEYMCVSIRTHEQILWFEVLITVDIFNQVEGMGAVFDVCGL